MKGDHTIGRNDPVSPKSKPGRRVARYSANAAIATASADRTPVTKLRLERNFTPRPRLFRSHGVSSAGGPLKPPSDGERSVRESSLPGGRRAGAKTASKA